MSHRILVRTALVLSLAPAVGAATPDAVSRTSAHAGAIRAPALVESNGIVRSHAGPQASPEAESGDALYEDSFDAGYLGRVINIHVVLPDGIQLPGRLFSPASPSGAAVIMVHGCAGLWSGGEPWTVAQAAIEKWGNKLAESGHFALAIDSYTSRTPAGVDPRDFQRQCTGDVHEAAVDPYTTRVADMDGTVAWLRRSLGESATARIAALGWSQGGQAVLVRSAETYRETNVSRFVEAGAESTAQIASVVFYPGCGTRLGFVEDGSLDGSFWRPHHDLRMNHGGGDPLHTSCDDRVSAAIDAYDSSPESGHWVDYFVYPNAKHSFDGALADWPAAKCAPDAPATDECAAANADIDSLEFLTSRLAAPSPP